MRRGPALKEVLRELRRAPGSVDDAESASDRRARVVGSLLRLQGSLPLRAARRERLRRVLLAAAAVLSVAVVAVALRFGGISAPLAGGEVPGRGSVVVHALGGLVEVSRGETRQVLGATPRSLAPEDRLETHSAALARVSLPSGASVSVGEASLLDVRDGKPGDGKPGDEELRVTQGNVDVQVPKLKAGQGFVVRTPDAVVTVKGTRFRVNVSRTEGEWTTRVDVSEGVVTVRSRGKHVELRAGDEWSSVSPPEAAVPAVPQQQGATRDVAGSQGGETGSSATAFPPTAVRVQSTLAEENELLKDAMAAARASSHARAAALFDSFLARHARSPLAENAAVERLRALARLGDRARAARAARRYLASYPGGTAVELARRLVKEAPDATSKSNGSPE